VCEEKVLPIYHHFMTRNKTLFYAAIFPVLVPFLYFQITSVYTIILQKFVYKNVFKFFFFPNRHLKISENKLTYVKKTGSEIPQIFNVKFSVTHKLC